MGTIIKGTDNPTTDERDLNRNSFKQQVVFLIIRSVFKVFRVS